MLRIWVAVLVLAACGGDERAEVTAKEQPAADTPAPDPLVANAAAFAKAQATLAKMSLLTTPKRIPTEIRQLTQNIVVLRDDHLAALAAGTPIPPTTGANAMKFPASPPSALGRVDTLVVVRGDYRRARKYASRDGSADYVPASYLGDVTVFTLPAGEYIGGFALTAATQTNPAPSMTDAEALTQLDDELVLNVGTGMLRGLSLFSGDAPPSGATKTVIITHPGPRKISTIKALRQITKQSLKETNGLLTSIPAVLTTTATDDEAAAVRDALVAEGATVEIR